MTKEEVQAKIDHYNQEISRLLQERKALMDESMPLFATAQIGDTIYSTEGRYLGIVTRLYRFQAGQNQLYDTSMKIDYEFRQPGSSNIVDNTSCHRYEIFGVITESEHKSRQLQAAKRLIADAAVAND